MKGDEYTDAELDRMAYQRAAAMGPDAYPADLERLARLRRERTASMGTRTTVGTITAAFEAIKANVREDRTIPLRRLMAADRLLYRYERRCAVTQFRDDLPDALIARAQELADAIGRFRGTTLDYRIAEADNRLH